MLTTGEPGTIDRARPAEAWLRIVLVASSVLFLVELEKAVLRSVVWRHRARAAQDAASVPDVRINRRSQRTLSHHGGSLSPSPRRWRAARSHSGCRATNNGGR
jgi:hypothetical protein